MPYQTVTYRIALNNNLVYQLWAFQFIINSSIVMFSLRALEENLTWSYPALVGPCGSKIQSLNLRTEPGLESRDSTVGDGYYGIQTSKQWLN